MNGDQCGCHHCVYCHRDGVNPMTLVPAEGEWLVRDGKIVELIEIDADPNPEGWIYTCYSGPEDE